LRYGVQFGTGFGERIVGDDGAAFEFADGANVIMGKRLLDFSSADERA
jgi:hypothetical protein